MIRDSYGHHEVAMPVFTASACFLVISAFACAPLTLGSDTAHKAVTDLCRVTVSHACRWFIIGMHSDQPWAIFCQSLLNQSFKICLVTRPARLTDTQTTCDLYQVHTSAGQRRLRARNLIAAIVPDHDKQI